MIRPAILGVAPQVRRETNWYLSNYITRRLRSKLCFGNFRFWPIAVVCYRSVYVTCCAGALALPGFSPT
jgi:hypothetical protein